VGSLDQAGARRGCALRIEESRVEKRRKLVELTCRRLSSSAPDSNSFHLGNPTCALGRSVSAPGSLESSEERGGSSRTVNPVQFEPSLCAVPLVPSPSRKRAAAGPSASESKAEDELQGLMRMDGGDGTVAPMPAHAPLLQEPRSDSFGNLMRETRNDSFGNLLQMAEHHVAMVQSGKPASLASALRGDVSPNVSSASSVGRMGSTPPSVPERSSTDGEQHSISSKSAGESDANVSKLSEGLSGMRHNDSITDLAEMVKTQKSPQDDSEVSAHERLPPEEKQERLMRTSDSVLMLSQMATEDDESEVDEPAELRKVTISGKDTIGRTISCELSERDSVLVLSGRSLRSVDLSAVTDLPGISKQLKDISLVANALESIDLSPLAKCTGLSAVMLNGNHLRTIDLGPLSSCPLLERLWLHNNRLETVDLKPLAECESLRSIYLDSNRIDSESIDLGPLRSCKLLRSLRLTGNRLSGRLDVTPLLTCAGLSAFDVNASVKLVASYASDTSMFPSALRRRASAISWHQPLEMSISPNRDSAQVLNAAALQQLRASTSEVGQKGLSPAGSTPSTVSPLSETPSTATSGFSATSSELRYDALLVSFRVRDFYATRGLLSEHAQFECKGVNDLKYEKEGILAYDAVLLQLGNFDVGVDAVKNLRQLSPHVPIVIIGTEQCAEVASACLRHGADRFLREPLSSRDAFVIRELVQLRMRRGIGTTPPSASPHSASPPGTSPPGASPGLSPPTRSPYGASPPVASPPSETGHEVFSVSGCETGSGYDAERREQLQLHAKLSQLQPSKTPPESFVSARTAPVNLMPTGSAVCDLKQTGSIPPLMTLRRTPPVPVGGIGGSVRNKMERPALEKLFARSGGKVARHQFTPMTTLCGLPVCAAPLLFKATAVFIGASSAEYIDSRSFMAFWDSNLRDRNGEGRLFHIMQKYSSIVNNGSDENGNRAPVKTKSALGRNMICVESFQVLADGLVKNLRSRIGDGAWTVRAVAACLVFGLTGVAGAGVPVRLGDIQRVSLCSRVLGAESGMYDGPAMYLRPDRFCGIRSLFESIMNTGDLELTSSSFGSANGVHPANGSIISSGVDTEIGPLLSQNSLVEFCKKRALLTPRGVAAVFARQVEHPAHGMSLADFVRFWLACSELRLLQSTEYFFHVLDVDMDGYISACDAFHFYAEKEAVLAEEGLVLANFWDVWISIVDLVYPREVKLGFTVSELLKLNEKNRTFVIQALLMRDDNNAVIDIRRTMEK